MATAAKLLEGQQGIIYQEANCGLPPEASRVRRGSRARPGERGAGRRAGTHLCTDLASPRAVPAARPEVPPAQTHPEAVQPQRSTFRPGSRGNPRLQLACPRSRLKPEGNVRREARPSLAPGRPGSGESAPGSGQVKQAALLQADRGGRKAGGQSLSGRPLQLLPGTEEEF